VSKKGSDKKLDRTPSIGSTGNLHERLAAGNASLWIPALWIPALRFVSKLAILLFLTVADQPAPSHGQESPAVPPGGMMPPENLPRVVGPGVLPDLMYMRNDKGEEILVPRARYEDFERLLMETELGGEGLAATPSLNQLDLLIEPVTDYAKVQVRGLISLKKANRTTWTVPIALSQLQWLLDGTSSSEISVPAVDPKAEGTADKVESIATSVQANGYLWRLGPSKSLQRRLELDAVCKLVNSPNGNTLRLDLPPAATVIKLKLPKGDWELNANGGGNEVVEPFQIQGEHAVAIVRTSSSSINLTWNRKASREAIAAIEVRSQTKFSPSSDANRWRADSALSIRGPIKLGGKRIRWTLPPQSLLREANSNVISFSTYRLVRDTTNDPNSADPVALTKEKPLESWWIEIDDAYGRSELDINLEWELARNPNDARVRFEAPNLEGVERHNGAIEFAIPRTNSIDWTPTGNVQLTRQSQAADGSDSIVYSFQFDGQPASIATQWTTVADRPRISSEQRVEVRENRLLLRGFIEFGSDPIQLPLLQLEVQGWKPERIVLHPSEIDVPLDSIPNAGQITAENPAGSWSLPISANLWIRTLSAARPTGTEPARSERNPESGIGGFGLGNPFEIIANSTDKKESISSWKMEYLFSRANPPDSNAVTFSLPQLSWLSQETQQRVTRSAPGRLMVFSWPYRLTTSATEQFGLVETSLDRIMQKQVLSSSTGVAPFLLQYQIADSTGQSRWTGQRIRKGSFVSARLLANATPVRDSIEWNLRWDCKCLGSRPTELMIGFPIESARTASELSNRDISIQVDNKDAVLEWSSQTASPADNYKWAKIQVPEVALDGSNRLDFLVEAKYLQDQPALQKSGEQIALDLMVATLAKARDYEQVLVDEVELRVQGNASFSLSKPGEAKFGIYELEPTNPRLSLTLLRRNAEARSSPRIDGEWVQTIVNAIEQRDRYVARFTTDQRFIRVPISSEMMRDAEWMINGQRASVREDADSKGFATVTLPEQSNATETNTHVLEVFTTQSAPKGWLRRVRPIGPRIQTTPSSAPLIWQIIVPKTEHLVSSTQNALPMYQWRWHDLFFRREGAFSQADIEKRFGATEQPILAQQVNQYDLTSIASAQPLEATFVPSALIWLPVSLFVLLLSTTLKDNRWIRWPWFWAVSLAAFFIFSQIAWDISILVLQAAIASVSLALFYAIARWIMDRRARRRSIFVSRQYAPSSTTPKGGTGSQVVKKASSDASALRSTVSVKPRDPQ